MRKSNTNVGLCNRTRRHYIPNCTIGNFDRNQVGSRSADDRSTSISELISGLPCTPAPALSTIEGVRR
jgi:hypothetical protein